MPHVNIVLVNNNKIPILLSCLVLLCATSFLFAQINDITGVDTLPQFSG